MSSKTINRTNIGTYNVSYITTDEAGNSTTKDRNIFILSNIIQPTIQLKTNIHQLNRTLLSAVKPSSPIDYNDLGYIATDAYGNSSEDFPMLKRKVTTEHFEHTDKDDINGRLIYSETNGVENIPNGVDHPGKITQKVKSNYVYLFKDGILSSFYDNNWTPSNDDYQTAYFSIKYTFNLPGFNPVSVTRKIYITDVSPPLINIASVTNPEQIEAGSIFADNVTFNIIENYWYFDNQTVPSGGAIGFSYPDGNNDPNQSIVIKDPSGTTRNSINTSVLGDWQIYYYFYATYNTSSVNGANYVPYPNPKPIPVDATNDNDNRRYQIVRTVKIIDTTPPEITLKKIGNGESNPLTFGSNNSGKLYTTNDSTNGDNYNLYFWVPLNSSTKPSLQEVLPNIFVTGEFGSTVVPSEDAEIIIRDNAGQQQSFNVTVDITTPPNISIPAGTSVPTITRNSVGTDFNDAFDYNFFPIAGTESNPAIYTIRYTVKDQSENETTISRRLYIIDRSIPDIIFKNQTEPVSFSTIGNGLIYNKNSRTTGLPIANKLVIADNNNETTYSDEFGDIVTKSIAFENSAQLISSYRKDRPQNVFLVSYDQPTDTYILKTFYNISYDPGTEVEIATETKESEIFFSPTLDAYPIYYFDLSDKSLTNRPLLLFEPLGNWGNNVSEADRYKLPSSYSPQGTYHSFLECNFTGANSDAGPGTNFIEIRERNSSNSEWVPAQLSVTLKTYDPNDIGNGLNDWNLN